MSSEVQEADRAVGLSMVLSSLLLFPSRPGLATWMITREPARSEVSGAIEAVRARVGNEMVRLITGVALGAAAALAARAVYREGARRVSSARSSWLAQPAPTRSAELLHRIHQSR